MGVLGISNDRKWLHIRFGNGETGWMSAELLARSLGQIEAVYDLTPAPPQRYGAYGWRATVNVSAGGNLRAAPDTAFRVKRTLPYGMEVKLRARSPYSPWVKVEAGDETGWMALFTLETESVISSLPIDYDVPLPPRATPTPSFSYRRRTCLSRSQRWLLGRFHTYRRQGDAVADDLVILVGHLRPITIAALARRHQVACVKPDYQIVVARGQVQGNPQDVPFQGVSG